MSKRNDTIQESIQKKINKRCNRHTATDKHKKLLCQKRLQLDCFDIIIYVLNIVNNLATYYKEFMKKVTIYTDGACSGNPGIGGWSAILIYNGVERQISGYNNSTTNNRMELFAVIQGLRALNQSCIVDIYTDSQYVADAFNKGWISAWQANNWKTSGKSEVKNVDLWKALLYEVNKHKVNFIKVEGHANVEYNELCDKLAKGEITKYQEILKK